MELPESAALVATDPKRVYHLGAESNLCLAPGAPLFLTRPCLRPAGPLDLHTNMLDGLRQGLVSTWSGLMPTAAFSPSLPMCRPAAQSRVRCSSPRERLLLWRCWNYPRAAQRSVDWQQE